MPLSKVTEDLLQFEGEEGVSFDEKKIEDVTGEVLTMSVEERHWSLTVCTEKGVGAHA